MATLLTHRFDGNTALGWGGAIASYHRGLAGANNTKALAIVDVQLLNNSASDHSGGAIMADGLDTINISGVVADNNRARTYGGAIDSSRSRQFILQGASFTQNACGHEGGAVRISGCNDTAILTSNFSKNRAQTGGAVNIASLSNQCLVLSEVNFVQNVASLDGGALSMLLPSPSISFFPYGCLVSPLWTALGLDSIFLQSNISIVLPPEGSGAVTSADHSTMSPLALLMDVVVEGNSATNSGGGIHVIDTTVDEAAANAIASESPRHSGSPILLATGLQLTGNSVQQASGGQGGGMSLTAELPFTLQNSSMTGNSCGGKGGSLYVHASQVSTLMSHSSCGLNNEMNGKGFHLLAVGWFRKGMESQHDDLQVSIVVSAFVTVAVHSSPNGSEMVIVPRILLEAHTVLFASVHSFAGDHERCYFFQRQSKGRGRCICHVRRRSEPHRCAV